MAAAAVLAASCASVPDGELAPKDTLNLGPTEAIVVGVAAVAAAGLAPPGFGHANWTALRLHLPGSPARYLHLTPAQGTVSAWEEGVPVNLRPFAFRLPAGTAQFDAFAVRVAVEKFMGNIQVKETNRYTGQSQMVTQPIYITDMVWQDEWLPGASVKVEPGQVVYIGRLGQLSQTVDFTSQQARNAACSPTWRVGLTSKWSCFARQVFVGTNPDVDLPLIRQRYPGLAGRQIEVRALEFNPGTWRGLSEALRQPRFE